MKDSQTLLAEFNAAADAAHIAALRAYKAAMDLKRSAEKLNNVDKGFSRAAYTGMYCEHPALALLETTGDAGDNVNDTPRSRGVELPKKTTDEKLQDFLDAPTVVTPWSVMENARHDGI